VTIHIDDIEIDRDATRIEMAIDGLPIWFESDDVSLVPATEAFAGALLIPALSTGRSLQIEGPVDPDWLAGASQVVRFGEEWWGFARLPILAGETGPPSIRRSEAALCFTGGVDSFHSLLTEDIDVIVQVHGFDIRLDDTDRLADAEADARHVARELGIGCVVVRTNLRSHPTFDAVPWELSHGGALAAVGHLLTDAIGSLGIASSSPRGTPGSWGSDYRLDPLWSSSRLTVNSLAIDAARIDKVAVVAAHPLARDHLRVCWEHLTASPNCSRCEKCIRTMVALSAVGRLAETLRFDGSILVTGIDALEPLWSSVVRDEYAAMLARGLPSDIARAVGDLIERSQDVGLRWARPET